MKRAFLVVGNMAKTESFSLNDIPGAGRMDILCRCVAQALFVSHGVRRDVEIFLLLLGPPNPPKVIRISGGRVKRMSPDERNIAGHLRKALSFKADNSWAEVNSGVYVAKKDIRDLLTELSEEYSVYYLREDGEWMENVVEEIRNPLFVLGDHLGVREDVEVAVLEFSRRVLSLSHLSLQAEQCITVAHYILDTFESRKPKTGKGKLL